MDELTEAERDNIRAFVENADDSFPELSDLPAMWDALAPDARSPTFPNYPARDMLIFSYINWSHTKRWAWDGLNRLLVSLEDRREPIPDALKYWARTVPSRQFRGRLKIPRKQGGGPFASKDDRDFRVMRVHNVLRQMGWTRDKAIGDIASACDMPEDTIESVVRKMSSMRPFKGATKSVA